VHGRKAVLQCEISEAFAVEEGIGVGEDNKPIHTRPRHARERHIEVVGRSRFRRVQS
jgi:hypothetical protein